jgi:hypothetical protein
MAAYTVSIIGVLALCVLSILLAIYSGVSKGRAGRSRVPCSRLTTTIGSTASTERT